ncbi:MAG TPA: epoxide hydrolase [Candidatus Limnocylindrales bacterium]|nr:epoxide hydrolase [Candidatus Limnocylindrales bacterium]
MSSPTVATATSVRPFQVSVPDEQLAQLRRRIAATQWPSKELVPDGSQGVQLTMLQKLATYWATDYDWRKCETELNALPQFKTEIDGLDIHFVHVKSRHENALPLIITHGWPGSVIEMLEVVGPLTDPTAYGGRAEDAFSLVLPSIPGYGFSGQPTEGGWGPERIAKAWAELMNRLGYTRYVAQGGDQGANITDAMGRLAPKGLLGVHLNLLGAFPTPVLIGIFAGTIPAPEGLLKRLAVAAISASVDKEPVAFNQTAAVFRRGYYVEMGEHPQTVGYSLTDSPVGLAAWMLDHDPDTYKKISRAFVDGKPVGGLTRDRILDNMTLYCLTGTAASAARLYWEETQSIGAALASGKKPPKLSLPVGFTVFPSEIIQAPRSWTEKVYPNLVYFHEADRGGHFAAWEEPETFSQELRAAFKTLR